VTEHAATAAPREGPSPPLPFRARLVRDAPFFLIAVMIVALDQFTKALVRGRLDRGDAWPDHDWFLHLVHVSNSGAAFGMLQGQTPFLIVTSLIGVAAIVLYYLYPPLDHGLLRVALALQLGGAAGNMIDRIRVGEVTDFVKFDWWIIDFPAFNVSDSSITIGVITILWFFLLVEGERVFGGSSEGD
jgi:signal peptidase II